MRAYILTMFVILHHVYRLHLQDSYYFRNKQGLPT